jgi:hypothetical protein
MSLARKDKKIRAKPETFASSYWLSMLPKLCDMKTDSMLFFDNLEPNQPQTV